MYSRNQGQCPVNPVVVNAIQAPCSKRAFSQAVPLVKVNLLPRQYSARLRQTLAKALTLTRKNGSFHYQA